MIKTHLIILTLLMLAGCISFFNGPPKTMEDVELQGAHIGLEYIPDPSFEGYNEIYFIFFQPRGTDKRKYLKNNKDGLPLSTFPKDPALLSGLTVHIIDTVRRTYEKYAPTETVTTLYVDPTMIDKESFETLAGFVKQSYTMPNDKNLFLLWMNRAYNVEDKPDTLYFMNTLYAMVYASLDSLEPQYASADGKRILRVGVDKAVYYKYMNDQNAAWLSAGNLKDSTFYFWHGHAKNVKTFGEYTFRGRKFSSLYKRTEQLQ